MGSQPPVQYAAGTRHEILDHSAAASSKQRLSLAAASNRAVREVSVVRRDAQRDTEPASELFIHAGRRDERRSVRSIYDHALVLPAG
jgi:hypothetical protein